MRVFDVYLKGKCIDTVFYSDSSPDEEQDVYRSLVDHDGYDARIVVKYRRKSRTKGRTQ